MIRATLFLLLILITVPWHLAMADSDCQITSEEIISHIKYLASDELEGRMAGSPGARKAANYISSKFREAGLRPLGDNNSYAQNFFFTKGISLGDDNSLGVLFKGEKKDLILAEDFNTLSFSSSGKVNGGLVFAGYGISAPELKYDDYEGIDVKDKVVLILRYTPEKYDPKSPFYDYAPLRYKAMNAREKGAKAIVFVTPHYAQEEEDITTVGVDYSYSDSGIQSLILKRSAAQEIFDVSGKELIDIEKNLSEKINSSFIFENTRAEIETEIIEEQGVGVNLVGVIEGNYTSLKHEYIVLGAHYDHIGYGKRNSRSANKSEDAIHNGADDNASGVAGLIELASYFSCNKDSLKRSVVFIAFSAEELGLIGASYYVDNPKVPLNKTVAMLNMDMIGRLDKKLTVFGVGSSPNWNEILDSANSNLGFELSLDNSGFAPSDQSVFFAKNIPVLHFFTGLHDDYHTPADDWQKINSEGEQKILDLISNVITELASSSKELPFSNTKEPKKGLANFNIYLGTIPDYSNQMEGVVLMGVKDGSPAQKAGLKSDDTIIEFNGFKIKNIYDYVYALKDSKPGVPTSLVVLRDYRPLSLVVVPEPRESEN